MILINPIHKIINGAVNDDYSINLAFAKEFKEALDAKKEECMLPLDADGNYLPNSDYDLLLSGTKFTVIFNIKCLQDISAKTSGFSIECTTYNALVSIIRQELVNWGLKSIYPMGYKLDSASTKAEYTEITIGLGFITNSADNAMLNSKSSRARLISAIVASAYSVPTRNTQPDADLGTKDPYFYDETKWILDTSTTIDNDNTTITDETIETVPTRILSTTTPTPKEKIDPETNLPVLDEITGLPVMIDVREKPLLWYTSIDNAVWGYDCIVIFSYRFKSTTGSLTLTVNKKSKTVTPADTKWHTDNFMTSITVENGYLDITIPESTKVDITAVWVAKSSLLGNIDDPLKKYTIYPPEYTLVTSDDVTEIAAYNGSVYSGTTLVSKAADTFSPASIAASITDAFSKIDQIPLNTSALTNSLSGVMKGINTLASGAALNLNSITADYSMLQSALSYVTRSDKKTAMMNAVNMLKNIEQAKSHLQSTVAQKQQQAAKVAAKVKTQMDTMAEELGKQ